MYNRMKHRMWELLEPTHQEDALSQAINWFIMVLIIMSVFSLILESVPYLKMKGARFFLIFNVFSIGVFTIEYLLRLWSCTSDERYASPVRGRVRFALSPMAIIDFLAIFPSYFPGRLDFRFLRTVRLFRLFRLPGMQKYAVALTDLGRALNEKREEIVIIMIVLTTMILFSSTLMYYVETAAQPEAFESIPKAMWWAVITLTTVGYGDVYPITLLGRFFAALIAIFGIGMVALPTGVLSSAFMEIIDKRKVDEKERAKTCPHCGEPIE